MDGATAAKALEAWYAAHARDLPWRRTSDPWAILVSEVLLQQTRVETGVQAFPRLLREFPTPRAMADASEQQVLRAWAGLGYYRRARNLQAAARALVEQHGGVVPRDPDALAALPGIGPYTAAAIAAFAFDVPAIPLDANVLRVLARWGGERDAIEGQAARGRLDKAGAPIVAQGSPRILAQAIMELGALVCTARAPACGACPLAPGCVARREGLQDELPRKRAKRVPTTERWAFVRLEREGHVLVERRGPGLLEGFWALPGVRASGAVAAERLETMLRAQGIPANVAPSAVRHRWAFSHRVWQFTVHPAELARPTAGKARLPEGFAWLPLADAAAWPIATAHAPHLATALAPTRAAAAARPPRARRR